METFSNMKTSPDCEIVTARIFNWPRKLVYQAWTEPEYLQVWWGPKGFTNTFNTFDFREGGKWDFIMHGPDKGRYHNQCTFMFIREPELLVWDRQSKPIFQVEVNFDELDAERTKVTFKQKFTTAEACDKIRKYTVGKNDENFDRLEAVLFNMKSVLA